MELTTGIIVAVIVGALLCELIDSALGMLYGTILSPVLIIAGFNPLLVVPSILLSQAIGGSVAAFSHHRLKNSDFTLKSKDPRYIVRKVLDIGPMESAKRGLTDDLKVTFCIIILGLAVTVFSVFVAISIPKIALKTYIGVLVLAMGSFLIFKSNFKFSWRKITAIGILSAFNKGISGGGFGPVLTSGQIISGREGKRSIGSTTLAEAPICITGFLAYFFTNGISDWSLFLMLFVGSVLGALAGPHLTSKFKSEKKLKLLLGVTVIGLGIWILLQTWF